jgi:hypothetical protein
MSVAPSGQPVTSCAHQGPRRAQLHLVAPREAQSDAIPAQSSARAEKSSLAADRSSTRPEKSFARTEKSSARAENSNVRAEKSADHRGVVRARARQIARRRRQPHRSARIARGPKRRVLRHAGHLPLGQRQITWGRAEASSPRRLERRRYTELSRWTRQHRLPKTQFHATRLPVGEATDSVTRRRVLAGPEHGAVLRPKPEGRRICDQVSRTEAECSTSRRTLRCRRCRAAPGADPD